MEDIKSEPLDFVKDFQEYLTQQTQHVNMISGSVGGERERDSPPQAENEQNGLDQPSVEVSLEDNSGLLADDFERTYDGKLKCRYCNYASKGTARLIEHMRIHTGEKPHRCHLCPFASAYERHLEAHMRSHTGEKPYKCELCSFRCSDRSNLSHHRRRRHKLLPMKGPRSTLSSRKMLGVLQKRAGSLAYSRRLFINFSPPSMVAQNPDYPGDFSHELPHLRPEAYKARGGGGRDAPGTTDNPLSQLTTLAGQLSGLPPESQTAESPDREEKPFLLQQVSSTQAVASTGGARTSLSPSATEPQPQRPKNHSPVAGPGSEHSSASVSNSQPSTPAPALPPLDPQLLQSCQYCDTYFADNILYTIHMGCHSYENPYQCNICGSKCSDKYDFACHFAQGQHRQ